MTVVDEFLARVASSSAIATRPEDATGLRAAVATIVREGAGGGEVLFIKRADRESDPWSGHMAFPGGRRNPTDATLLETATREALEEIGLDLAAHARAVARLPDVMPYARMPHPLTVTAFVFALTTDAPLTLNEEVADVVWAPLPAVLANEGATRFLWQKDGLDLDLPALNVRGHVIWGLTYRMVELLREAAR